MKTEIKDIRLYNPEYRKNKMLEWEKIGAKVGKHERQKKEYPYIGIEKITVPKHYDVDTSILDESREMYTQTHEMIPVYISFDSKLLAGYEQYELAKELKLAQIPFQRLNKPPKNQGKTLDRPLGNQKYAVKATDGSTFYVSANRFKKVRTSFRMANRLKCKLFVFQNFTFALINRNGEYICGYANKGKSLNAIRRFMSEQIGEKNGEKANAN